MTTPKIDILQMGGMYSIRPHSLSPLVDQVKPGIYNIVVDPKEGVFLKYVADSYKVPTKIWGSSARIAIQTVVKTLQKRTNSMGAILSGTMGSGKTMSAESICNKLIADGAVIIQVNGPYGPDVLHSLRDITPGLVVYYFSEFTTNYEHSQYDNGSGTKVLQSKMLEFFSDQTLNKSLFLLTLNNITLLSPMILNRPGRFLYHIKYVGVDVKTVEEIADDLNVSPLVKGWLVNYVSKLGSLATIDQILEIIHATRDCVTGEQLQAVIEILNVHREHVRLSIELPKDPDWSLLSRLQEGKFNAVEETLTVTMPWEETLVIKIGEMLKTKGGNELLIKYAKDSSTVHREFTISRPKSSEHSDNF